MFKKIKNKKGFTLIELMVVISIIGLLSSIVLASLKDARDKAANQKFKAEIMELVKALELYKADNGEYPYEKQASAVSTSNYSAGMLNNQTETVTTGDALLSTLLIPKYIKKLPTPPNNSFSGPSWTYRTNFKRSGSGLFVNSCFDDGALDRDDSRVPKYVVYVGPNNPIVNQFNEWSFLRAWYSTSGYTDLTDRCFSLK